MNILDRRIVLDVYVRQTVATVGTFAASEGKDEAATRAVALAGEFGEHATFPLRVSVADLVVGLVDYFREAGEPEQLEQAEAIIAALKRGEAPRLLIGSINFNPATVGELDDQLEHIHRVGAPIIEGR